MWRALLIILLLFPGIAVTPAAAQDGDVAPPVDLATMPLTPDQLPDDRYQFARGAYLTRDDARYLIEQRYAIDAGVVDTVITGARWRQGYTASFVLLSDRASDPIVAVTTTIHALENSDAATVLETLLIGAPPEGAEERGPALGEAVTWRVVSSQDDTRRILLRIGRFVVEVEMAYRQVPPDPVEHAEVVADTLDRIERVLRFGGPGLSRQMMLVDDDRMVPVAVSLESPLVHTWYRMLDEEVVLASGELAAPSLPEGATDIAIARQTAEVASQSWVTIGVVVARFETESGAAGFAESDIIRDPLDIFAAGESEVSIESVEPRLVVTAISGESNVGGRWSGYRVTLARGDLAAQMTIRSTGPTLVDRDAVEAWAVLQWACLAEDTYGPVPLADLLQVGRNATPAAIGDVPGVYESPVAPWSVIYNPTVWDAQHTFAEGGYDYLYLRADRIDATFETIVDHRGDPEACVLDELELLREDEEHARIDVGSDVEGEEPGGLENGHAWILYTVEPLDEERAGEEYVIRIDCYTVVEGSTSLVVGTRAPRDVWAEVAPMGEQLRAGIEIDGAPAGQETGDRLAAALSWRTGVMIDRRLWVGLAA
ncbi:MAG TPA: hypothetical protein VGR22_00910 [Thermomicrobiales bacterium]|nr:hypothetical protein [Thermomicrobiales bacterium]